MVAAGDDLERAALLGKSAAARRVVPVPTDLLQLLSARMIDRPADGLLFLSLKGKPWDYTRWNRQSWKPAVKEAGLTGLMSHDCRHSYASWLAEAGVDLYRIQKLLGHSSQAMVQRYAHLAPEHFDAVTEVVGPLGTHGSRTAPDTVVVLKDQNAG